MASFLPGGEGNEKGTAKKSILGIGIFALRGIDALFAVFPKPHRHRRNAILGAGEK
jgi:hypothetical protein